MLTIRTSQINALSEPMLQRFEQRMTDHLKRCFRRECAQFNDEDFLLLIRDGVARARRYRIETEREVAKYIDLMLVFSRNFDRYPKAAEVLLDEHLSAKSKIALLYAIFNDLTENRPQQTAPEA